MIRIKVRMPFLTGLIKNKRRSTRRPLPSKARRRELLLGGVTREVRTVSAQLLLATLTRRRYPERPDCWHVYYGDVRAGTIAIRSGVPFDVDQWQWSCGFYPASHRGVAMDGTAVDFDQARAEFETAWRAIQPKINEADYQEHRRQRARTAWKYAMDEAGAKLPTEMASGLSKCFCGTEITIKDAPNHVRRAHMCMA